MTENKKTIYVAIDSNSTMEAADLCGCDLVAFRSRLAPRNSARKQTGKSYATPPD